MNSNQYMPRHVGIIMDGNRRWAKKHGYLVLEGHYAGAKVAKELVGHLFSKGVHTVTIWVFSTENWNRNSLQVKGLMALFKELAGPYLSEAADNGVRVAHFGNKKRLPKSLLSLFAELEKSTEHHTKHCLNVAMDYGGKDEIIRAVKKIVQEGITSESITEELFSSYLDSASQQYPEPDLVIRTGGEHRTSGFLIWQSAYAEYAFPDKYLPEMTTLDLDVILDEYSKRHRRFGK